MVAPDPAAPLFDGEDKRPRCRDDIEHWIRVYSELLEVARRHPVPPYVDKLEARLSVWQGRRRLADGGWGEVARPHSAA